MKIFTKKGILQKTILVILTVLCINFIVPTYSQAGIGDALYNVGGVLANALIDLCAMIGDAFSSGMQWFMTGQFAAGEKFRDSAIMVEQGDDRIVAGAGTPSINVSKDDLDLGKNTTGDTYQVPVIRYTPEEIFANKVPYLDINFIKPTFNGQEEDYKIKGTAAILQGTISGWYIALRNLAIVGLLCVLVYVGIRIIISSTAADKAKHKQMFMDWLIALCLLFFLHYIMSFTLVLIDSVNGALTGNDIDLSGSVVVNVEGGTSFTTNVMGAARFMVQSKDNMESFAYLIVYLVLIFYTGIFTYHYLKRVLTMAFLTIIAPLVALTYPIDKIGDGKAQAFNMWLKEYVYTALIQPFHLIIYMIFVGSAMELVKTNFIFAIAAVAFILPAEKLLKKMFGFDKAPLGMMGPLATFTAGSLASKFGGKSGSRGGSSAPSNKGGSANKEGENDKPRFERKHGTDGIDYNNNPKITSENRERLSNEQASGENNEEDSTAKKAAEAFAEQQRRQEEQQRQRQLEEQQRQLAEQQDAIRKQELEKEDEEEQKQEQQKRLEGQQTQIAQPGKDKDKQPKQPGRFRQGIRNVVSAHGGKKGIALKGARTLGRAARFTAKTGARVALGAAGTVIGAAGGLASGKGIAGVLAGATAGRKIGTGVANTGINAASTVGRVATNVGRKAVSGTRNTIDTFNGNTKLNDKHTARMFMKDASTDQYIRDKWTKDHNGQAPSAQQLRQEKQAIKQYADEGMTDIAQIYRARKAENFGVDAKQSAKIALLAQDRKIDSSVLGDDKKYNQRKEDFTQEFMDKGLSETEAANQADYVLNVMKAQVGQRHNLPKSGKAKTKPINPVEPPKETKNSSSKDTTKIRTPQTSAQKITTPSENTPRVSEPRKNSASETARRGSRAPKSTNPAMKGPGTQRSTNTSTRGTKTNTSGVNPQRTNKPGPKGPRKK